jgi:hypothetical protein
MLTAQVHKWGDVTFASNKSLFIRQELRILALGILKYIVHQTSIFWKNTKRASRSEW